MTGLSKTRALVILAVLVALVTGITASRATHESGWPDEWIYLTLARNILERGTLQTNFYIASSIETVGYPHRDVHLPGYAFAVAVAGLPSGVSFNAAVVMNIVCFAVTVVATFLIGLRFLSVERSLLAAAMAGLAPPYAGYLFIVYPEHVTAAALMALAAWASWVERSVSTFVLGLAFGASLLFRETLLLAFPALAFLVGARRTMRAFAPGLVAGIAAFVMPFSKLRAVHPNALYPSAVTAALATPTPFTSLVETVFKNVAANWRFLVTSDPRSSAEDAVLLFLLGLAVAGALLSFGVEERVRGFLRAVVVSTAILFAAMLVLYVVRERGGVWGGVRALMPMAPLLLVGLCGLKIGRPMAFLLSGAFLSACLYLSSWQITFFNRYKQINIEDQARAAKFIEDRTRRYAPRRVVGGRYFKYGFDHFPVEVCWHGPEDARELDSLYLKFPYDFVILHRRDPLRFDLRKDARYEWTNAAEGQAAEYQIYRRAER